MATALKFVTTKFSACEYLEIITIDSLTSLQTLSEVDLARINI